MRSIFLELDGTDFRSKPLLDRKARSGEGDRNGTRRHRVHPHIEGNGADIFKAACKLGHEGIVAKRKDLPYESGRSKRWLRIENTRRPRGGSRKEHSRKTAGNGRLTKWIATNSR